MNNEDEIWAYDEPHESGGNVHITMTKKQAAEWMKNSYQKLHPSYKYMNDEEAFNEFVAVNWAYKVSSDEDPDPEC
jgi:hypothetical protein